MEIPEIEILANALFVIEDKPNKQIVLRFDHQGLGDTRIRVADDVFHSMAQTMWETSQNLKKNL